MTHRECVIHLIHVYHVVVRMFEYFRRFVDRLSNGCYKSNIAAGSNT